jgi:hypothetical protein
MAPRLPKPKSLEEAEHLMNQLMKHKAILQEDERKADTQHKIILGGAVIALSKVKPEEALMILRLLDRAVVAPKDREKLEAYLPGGSVFEGLVAGGKTGRTAPQKPHAPVAVSEPKLVPPPVAKPVQGGPGLEQKTPAPVVAKPFTQAPIALGNLDGAAERNRAGNGAGGVGSLPFASEEKPVEQPRLPIGTPLKSLGLFGSKMAAADPRPGADRTT